MKKKITLITARKGGFCFGVSRAVEKAYEELSKSQHVYSLGNIIHNDFVVDDFKKKGLHVVENVSEIKEENAVAIIRAHGAGKDVYDELLKRKIPYIDATCPFVSKIHAIVREKCEEGYEIFIIGDKTHPEVKGIDGWCNPQAEIFLDEKEILSRFSKCPAVFSKRIAVVCQTTIKRETFLLSKETLKKLCTNPIFFDTICNATYERQREALEISQKSDLCLVLGSDFSSNTQKLKEVCEKNCSKVFRIADESFIPYDEIKDGMTVGVLASASTPALIIKEVTKGMSEEMEVMNQGEEMDFAKAFEESFITLNTGDVVKGTVVSISPTEVNVNLGAKYDAYIQASEFTDDPSVNIKELVKPGDEVEACVVRVNDVDGVIMLSKKRLDFMKGWDTIEKAKEDGTILDGVVVEAIKGGMIVLTNGVRAFVPASLAVERFTPDLSTLVKTKVRLRIIDVNKQRHRVTGSVKSVLLEERKAASEKIWAGIEEGKTYKGVVKSVTSYGAFVDIGGVDGMVHVSELSWSRIKHPSDVMSVGDIVEVYILGFDKETGKISLGYKKKEDNPWEVFKAKYNVGDVVSCKIVKMMPFGAFAEIMPGIDGLIHISQISDRRIAKPSDVLAAGQEVEAKITEINAEANRVSLSIKALLAHEAPAVEAEEEKTEE